MSLQSSLKNCGAAEKDKEWLLGAKKKVRRIQSSETCIRGQHVGRQCIRLQKGRKESRKSAPGRPINIMGLEEYGLRPDHIEIVCRVGSV